MRRLTAAAAVVLATAITACGHGSSEEAMVAAQSAGAEAGHIHGLGVNPADDSLFVATHAGLFRASASATQLARVGTSNQDTMGFTVVGPDRFFGSGHPGPGEEGPPMLGLIESGDGGESWETISLPGEADFHVLRYAHGRVYAFNGLTRKLMLSDDGGETWSEQEPPAYLVDLAIDPENEDRIVASTERGLALSEDGGRSWKPVEGDAGLLVWPTSGSLYSVNAEGEVSRSADPGGRWRSEGSIGGAPAALAATEDGVLLAGLADGSVVSSNDRGTTWEERAAL